MFWMQKMLREHQPTTTISMHTLAFSNCTSAHLSDRGLYWLENTTLNCFNSKAQESTDTFSYLLRQPTLVLSKAHIGKYLPKNDFVSLDDIIEDFGQDVLHEPVTCLTRLYPQCFPINILKKKNQQTYSKNQWKCKALTICPF